MGARGGVFAAAVVVVVVVFVVVVFGVFGWGGGISPEGVMAMSAQE